MKIETRSQAFTRMMMVNKAPGLQQLAAEVCMEEIVATLISTLFQKGFTPEEIPKLVEDVVHIIGDGGEFTTRMINQDLKRMGWERSVVDQFTFELIMSLLEDEGRYDVRSVTIH